MRPLAALLVAALAAGTAWGQNTTPQITQPTTPSRAALDRLNLQLGWRTYVPLDGQRDGLATVQFLNDLVLVQTRSGLLAAYESETGALRWQLRPGAPYPPVPLPAGFNTRFLFYVNGTQLYQIDRGTGGIKAGFDLPTAPSTAPIADDVFLFVCTGSNKVICYLIDPEAGLTTTKPGAAKTAAPAANSAAAPAKPASSSITAEEQKKNFAPPPKLNPDGSLAQEPEPYGAPPAVSALDSATRIGAPGSGGGLASPAPSIAVVGSVVPPYRLPAGGTMPSITVVPSVVPPYSLVKGGGTPSVTVLKSLTELNPVFRVGPLPKLLWDMPTGNRLEQAPLLTASVILTPTAGSAVLGNFKETRKYAYTFAPANPVSGPLGQYETIAYVPLTDGGVFALDMDTGRILWRYSAGGPVQTPMIVTDEDVFLAATGQGLARVTRATGDQVWHTPLAVQLLAVNRKFVYARDRTGQLLVLDRARGQILASLDTRDFTVPVTDTRTDRLILAANNGLIVSLHDRDYPQPLLLRPDPVLTAVKLPEPKPAEEKKPEPKLVPAKPAETKPAAPKPAAPKPDAPKPDDKKPDDKKPGDDKKPNP
jgi:PQQ-like domain